MGSNIVEENESNRYCENVAYARIILYLLYGRSYIPNNHELREWTFLFWKMASLHKTPRHLYILFSDNYIRIIIHSVLSRVPKRKEDFNMNEWTFGNVLLCTKFQLPFLCKSFCYWFLDNISHCVKIMCFFLVCYFFE